MSMILNQIVVKSKNNKWNEKFNNFVTKVNPEYKPINQNKQRSINNKHHNEKRK